MTKHICNLGALLLLTILPGCGHRHPTDADLFNGPAAIEAGKLPFNPLHWKVITSGIDSQHQTMSTLYGNEIAVASARAGHDAYPDGAALSLVTWTQREDPHWFGARIPGKVQSVEFVMISGKDASYQRYDGQQLVRTVEDTQSAAARKDAILAQRASVMP
jgi:hypothetical protein